MFDGFTVPSKYSAFAILIWCRSNDEMKVNGAMMHFYRKPKHFGGLQNQG
jgi:hypothetical protein